MSKIKCSLSYHTISIDLLDVFAVGVRDGVLGNVILFPMPPVGQPTFQILIDDYINTRGAYKQGGLAQKGNFMTAKDALIAALDQTAEYVDSIASGNENIITEGGFVPTKAVSSDKPVPAQPVNVEMERGATGQLLCECPKVEFAEYYGAVLMAGEPLTPDILISGGQIVVQDGLTPSGPAAAALTGLKAIIDMNKSRKKKFTGLQAGTIYYVYFYAANASGVSAFSDMRSLMCG